MGIREPTLTVLLLDGHNLLYRAFTSLPASIEARDGRPINAVYGLVSTIIRLAGDTESTQAVAAFDVPNTPTFRHRLYPTYQGQRGPLGGENAADFARQTSIAGEVLPSMGVPVLRCPGYEADDILGTLSLSLAKRGDRSVIVSTDRDLLQLVRPGIQILAPGNPPVIARNSEDVRARLGVDPGGVTEFKALAGDTSDNIPGVGGIGVKTAAFLVNEYGNLETIYDNIMLLAGRLQTNLARDRALAFLFRQLVTVLTDLDLALEPAEIPTLTLPDGLKVRDILEAAGYGRP